MSYLPIDQNANTQGPTGQTTNTPGQTGGAGSTAPPAQAGGSVGAGSAASPTGASNGSPTQFGSSASKLGDYLTANAPQIGAQAANVAGGLNQQYGQVQGDITNAANNFGSQVQGGYTPGNSGLVDQAAANPTSFAATPGNVSAFQGQLNDQYTGPTSFEGSTPYSAIQNEVGSAVQNAGLLNTQSGLQNYLAGTQGGNQTQASNTLDTLLLQGNPAAQQQIQQAAGQFSGLTGQLGQATTGADQGVAAAQQAAQGAQNYAQTQLNPVATQFGNTLNNQLATDQTGNAAYNAQVPGYNAEMQALNAAINGWNAGSENIPNYSVRNTQLTNPFANLTAQPNSVTPTLANTATAPQYAEANALQQLLGQGYNAPLNQANVNQAGGYTTPADLNMAGIPAQIGTVANQAINTFNQIPGGQAASGTGVGGTLGQQYSTQLNNLLNNGLAPYDPNIAQQELGQ
jgi:hypothetical protein